MGYFWPILYVVHRMFRNVISKLLRKQDFRSGSTITSRHNVGGSNGKCVIVASITENRHRTYEFGAIMHASVSPGKSFLRALSLAAISRSSPRREHFARWLHPLLPCPPIERRFYFHDVVSSSRADGAGTAWDTRYFHLATPIDWIAQTARDRDVRRYVCQTNPLDVSSLARFFSHIQSALDSPLKNLDRLKFCWSKSILKIGLKVFNGFFIFSLFLVLISFSSYIFLGFDYCNSLFLFFFGFLLFVSLYFFLFFSRYPYLVSPTFLLSLHPFFHSLHCIFCLFFFISFTFFFISLPFILFYRFLPFFPVPLSYQLSFSSVRLFNLQPTFTLLNTILHPSPLIRSTLRHQGSRPLPLRTTILRNWISSL